MGNTGNPDCMYYPDVTVNAEVYHPCPCEVAHRLEGTGASNREIRPVIARGELVLWGGQLETGGIFSERNSKSKT